LNILNIKNLNFSYDNYEVLENINLTIEEKDFLAIIGPNGGGKSTLIKILLGINKNQAGTIEIFNNKIENILSQIGYVPQNTNINIDFPIKVIEVVMMGYDNTNKNFFDRFFDNNKKDIAIEALKQVSMEKFANKKIGSLSGGQRQRVMIARALCNNPKLLILDEPTASIDIEGQTQIYKLLKELNKKITIIVVSHDISVILEYANKVAHINKNLVFHDISKEKKTNLKNKDEHFCEVEMLQLLGKCKC
jgi:zinc transport system ATP-binding protein